MEFFWSCDLILCVILYQYTKFEPNPSILHKVMAILSKSNMAPASILFLRKWWFWSRFLLHVVILHQHTKFDENPPIRGVEIALLLNPNWRPPLSWILDRWHL